MTEATKKFGKLQNAADPLALLSERAGDLLPRRTAFHATDTATNLAPRDIVVYQIPEDGIHEVTITVFAITAQTSTQRFSLKIRNESDAARYSEQVAVKAAGDTRQFRTLRRFVRKDWRIAVVQEDTIALNETVGFSIVIEELLL